MKFTDGLWMARSGMKIHRTHKMWEYSIGDGFIRVMTPCLPILSLDDTTRGPVMVFTFSAPRPDMIRVHMEHFSGTEEKGPFFELNTQDFVPEILDRADSIAMISGMTRLVIDKEGPFVYRFYYGDKLLTTSDEGAAAYITDVDYEAHKVCDYNARPEPVHYMDKTYVRQRLALGVGEYIYGLGERFTPMIKNGQEVDIWNRDGGSCSDQSYKSIPFHLSSFNYGVLVNTPARVQYEVGTESVRHTQFSVEGERLEYILIGGQTPLNVLENYTALIGRSPVPPAWSFGLWLSTSWTPDSTREITLNFIDTMAKYNIPLSVFHFDARWMDDYRDCDFVWSKRYGNPVEMLREIHQRGVKVCCWINPYVSQMSRLFEEGKKGGYFLKNEEGGIWQTDVWMPGMAIVDFTNPEAAAWYAGRLGEIIDMGVDCIKTDFGERIPIKGVRWFDGSDPAKMHNYYPYIYNKTIFGMLEKKLGKGEACVFARSATVGTQQFPVNWGGDNEASYISMAESLRGGLSLCQSGYGFFSHDMSGFCGTATPDLYKRWAAFGMLSTHSRLHGQSSYRAPWYFDEESCDVLGHFARLKCRLMPYLYAQANGVHLYGHPMMQAMMLQFPDDPNCLTLDRQYMLGNSLLTAPVFREDGSVSFYVPEGAWTDIQTGEVFQGLRWYSRSYDYKHLPLLARPNSVIAFGATNSQTVYDYAKDTLYRVYGLSDAASCTVYDANCREALLFQAEYSENRITLRVSGEDAAKPWTAELCGIEDFKQIEGGQGCRGNFGLMVTPNPEIQTITIYL